MYFLLSELQNNYFIYHYFSSCELNSMHDKPTNSHKAQNICKALVSRIVHSIFVTSFYWPLLLQWPLLKMTSIFIVTIHWECIDQSHKTHFLPSIYLSLLPLVDEIQVVLVSSQASVIDNDWYLPVDIILKIGSAIVSN